MPEIYKFEYTVRPVSPESSYGKFLPNGGYIATTPYRHVVWGGETEQEAIGSMLYGLCDMVKRGCLDPDDPLGGQEPVSPVGQSHD